MQTETTFTGKRDNLHQCQTEPPTVTVIVMTMMMLKPHCKCSGKHNNGGGGGEYDIKVAWNTSAMGVMSKRHKSGDDPAALHWLIVTDQWEGVLYLQKLQHLNFYRQLNLHSHYTSFDVSALCHIAT